MDAPPALDATNSTFKYVRSVTFAIKDRGPFLHRRETTINDVATWLERLRHQGTERLWLVIPQASTRELDGFKGAAHILVAFAGGGTWHLVATGGRRARVWNPLWDVGALDAPDQRIWDVHYQGKMRRRVSPPRPSAVAAAGDLRTALSGIRAFARDHDLTSWVDQFDGGLDALGTEAPEPPYHPDLIPGAYPADARRVLAAAAHSWVFGGMGSWNDVAFDGQEDTDRYQAVSGQLYSAVLAAIIAAVNVDL
jgi:hypothetical protein